MQTRHDAAFECLPAKQVAVYIFKFIKSHLIASDYVLAPLNTCTTEEEPSSKMFANYALCM